MSRLEARSRSSSTPKVRRHRPDYQIVLYMGLLMLIGLITMYAIGPQRANVLNSIVGSDYSSSYFFSRQFFSLVLAIVTFTVIASVPFELIRKNAKPILVIGLAACVLLALLAAFQVDQFVQCTYGACRWFSIGSISVQPAEILKFGLLLFGAVFLGTRMKQGLINDTHKTLIPFAGLICLSLFFIAILQKDLGTGVAVIAIALPMLLIAGVKYKILGVVCAVLLAGVAMLVLIAPHRMPRVATFMGGDTSSLDDPGAYHIEHAKIAIGSGGIDGVGIGNSVQATGYLPEAINDSVFAIMGETFGFVGLVVILTLFTALLIRLLKIMDSLEDPAMKLMVAGVFGWFGSHVVLNVAAMIGVAPLTGITLPLLSYGGTSMVFITAALGLAFQLSSYGSHRMNRKETRYEGTRSRRGVGRTRYASSRRASRA